MKREILGNEFEFFTNIEPEKEATGVTRQFMPQSQYRNLKRLPLNQHGSGPFCQFRISPHLPFMGVYFLNIGDQIVYVGECMNLSERFNARGYGSIHPRNCFQGGQPTNCKINNLILKEAQRGNKIELWFCQTTDRKSLEATLIRKLKPAWNVQYKL